MIKLSLIQQGCSAKPRVITLGHSVFILAWNKCTVRTAASFHHLMNCRSDFS